MSEVARFVVLLALLSCLTACISPPVVNFNHGSADTATVNSKMYWRTYGSSEYYVPIRIDGSLVPQGKWCDIRSGCRMVDSDHIVVDAGERKLAFKVYPETYSTFGPFFGLPIRTYTGCARIAVVLKPGRNYRANGIANKEATRIIEVWLEDEDTHERASASVKPENTRC